MDTENKILEQLTQKFSVLKDKARVQRQKRIFAEAPLENFFEVLEYAKEELEFSILIALTGLDEGTNLGFIYHLAREDGITLNLKITAAKDGPSIKSVTEYYQGAEIYEREAIDLLGARIEGLKEGKRYPLPDGWPRGHYPLRKDWNAGMLKNKEA